MNENALFDMLPLIVDEIEQKTGEHCNGDLTDGEPLFHIKANAVAIIQFSKKKCQCCGRPASSHFSKNIGDWYQHAYKLLLEKGLFEWTENGTVLRVN